MSEIIGWIEKLQGLGIGGLSLFFLYITNKWWVGQAREREENHAAAQQQIREDFSTVIDAKDTLIGNLSDQLREAAQQSRSDMERQMQRQVDSARRIEETIAASTVAVTNLQDLVRAIPRGGA